MQTTSATHTTTGRRLSHSVRCDRCRRTLVVRMAHDATHDRFTAAAECWTCDRAACICGDDHDCRATGCDENCPACC